MSRKSSLIGLPLRAVAARLLSRLQHGEGSLSDGLPEADAVIADSRDRALLRLMLYETLRSFYRRKSALASLLQRPLAASAREVEALLLLGLTQLDLGIDVDYAVVDSTVEATRALGQPQLAGLVNAILRRALREATALRSAALQSEACRFDHPQWLIDRLRIDWGAKADLILDANNAQPPLWIRVNTARYSRDALQLALRDASLECIQHPHLADALSVTGHGDVLRFPGWQEGWFSVQDAAAQAAVEMLDLKPGLRVLDACAAPGGKLAHIAEREPGLRQLLGLDNDAKRIVQTRESLARLGLAPELMVADASNVSMWWQGELFDRILLDAPCSGTGVIRRHPDIRLLRRDSDVAELVDKQRALLAALWPLLTPGGRLVYSTCSVLKDENEHQIAAFLSNHPDAFLRPNGPEWFGEPGQFGWQNLPGQGDADGFYYAVLERSA